MKNNFYIFQNLGQWHMLIYMLLSFYFNFNKQMKTLLLQT